ncbi:hypothetical protein PghCCS26_62610 [Paenibacillus glycanilyticus]|uniref:Uncharacterized protein n=1 Tax=Paenibacillus glycanilyticus TaxID=126569 RepID=A0ABQ6NVL6_9BACL|nr:hypothetical protein [Paenibacillus glycanilyticus]GMK49131.1 hypothetical protein PghCCS26_62610 [Paenibacillus glycanilyticus]
MKKHISFRLRKELDADLIGMEINEDELPDLCRNGLRLMLGIRTVKSMEIQERPLFIPAPAQHQEPTRAHGGQKEKTTQPQTRPVVFMPKNRTN